MEALTVSIIVQLDGAEWVKHHVVVVPPDYKRQDIEPFIRHEIDKAVADLQRDNFGEARSAEIIEQLDRRLTVIKRLLRLAPHSIRGSRFAERVREVIDLDRAQLYARFGRVDAGD